MDVAWEYQHNAVEIAVAAEGDNRPQIDQYCMLSSGSRRLSDMTQIIDQMDYHRVMVFANMKTTVRQLGDRLRRQGRSADCLHGDIPQSQRNQVMHGFREGKFEILVATDVAAAASTWTTWRRCLTTIFPTKTSITCTASAAPAGLSGKGRPLRL